MNMSGHPNQQNEFFAEYSLWNDSTFCTTASINPMHFTRPVFEESIFQEPPSFESKAITDGKEPKQSGKTQMSNPWFESYLKRSLQVVKREDLLKDPETFHGDIDLTPTPDVASTSFWAQPDQAKFLPAPRNGRHNNTRGRKNCMQRRLEKALQCPNMEKASMMQCLGWEGGPLGRDGGGVIDPIAPNAQYTLSTSLFTEDTEELPEVEPIAPPPKRVKTNKKPKMFAEYFRTNILLNIREFVKNDLQVELFFDPSLNNNERKKVHHIVAVLVGEEPIKKEVYTLQQIEIIRDIHKRNAYVLGTESEGDPRQMCIYKEAPEYMFLVTPPDVRAPPPDPDEETNPFLKSITKHMKDSQIADQNPPTIFEKLIQYFIEFADDEYTEFRFLGPFIMDEITIMNSFLGLISCLAKNEPCVSCPEELLKVFERGVKYSVDEDCNGYVSIKKLPDHTEMET